MPDIAATQPGFTTEHWPAAAHQADVETGAARITYDDFSCSNLCGSGDLAEYWGERRTRSHHVNRAFDHVGDMHDATQGYSRQELAREPRRTKISLHFPKMRLHERLQRGVNGGRRGAPILADNWVQLVRERERYSGELMLEQSAHRQLDRGVSDGPEKTDGDRLDIEAPQLPDNVARLSVVESDEHVAVRGDALADLEGEMPRYIGLGVLS